MFFIDLPRRYFSSRESIGQTYQVWSFLKGTSLNELVLSASRSGQPTFNSPNRRRAGTLLSHGHGGV